MAKQQTIGNVKLSYLSKTLDTRYADSIEDELLDLFKSPDALKHRQQILNSNPTWEFYYHLSSYRGAVIDWFDFKPGSSVLEIGAGAGAVTEALVKKPLHVTALDISERRCLINAYRNQAAENLNVVVGNLEQLDHDTFDYAVVVGVLEYAGTFIDSADPYKHFLELVSKRLSNNGKLVLAIENRLGLKYLAGAREDHTGNFFDGLNQYPSQKNVRTFGRQELTKLLASAGFKSSEFHYPFPDYKNPQLIYSDDYYPGNGADFPLGKLPTPVPGQTRATIFSEALAMLSLEKNDLFRDLSNSFIVVASRG